MPHITKVRLLTPQYVKDIRVTLAKKKVVTDFQRRRQETQEQSFLQDIPVDEDLIKEERDRWLHCVDGVDATKGQAAAAAAYHRLALNRRSVAIGDRRSSGAAAMLAPPQAEPALKEFNRAWGRLKKVLGDRDPFGDALIDVDGLLTCVKESGVNVDRSVALHFANRCLATPDSTKPQGETGVKYRKWFREIRASELASLKYRLFKGVSFGSSTTQPFNTSVEDLNQADQQRRVLRNKDKKKLLPLGETLSIMPWATISDAQAPIPDMEIHDAVKKRIRYTLQKHERNLNMPTGCVPRHIFVEVLGTMGFSPLHVDNIQRAFSSKADNVVYYEKFLQHIRADLGVRKMAVIRPHSQQMADRQKIEDKIMSLSKTTVLPSMHRTTTSGKAYRTPFEFPQPREEDGSPSPEKAGRQFHCMYCGEYKPEEKFDLGAIQKKRHMCLRCTMDRRFGDDEEVPRAARPRRLVAVRRQEPATHSYTDMPQIRGVHRAVPSSNQNTWKQQQGFLTSQYGTRAGSHV